MKYQLIGIDLDGTLLDAQGRVPRANAMAVAAAIDAGATVVPCTGRAWIESRSALAELPGVDRGVFVTGAAICQARSGRSLDLAVIEPHLAMELVEFLDGGPEAVLVFREASSCGHDYLVTGRGELTGNTRWWFEHVGANVHFQRQVTADDLHHTLRVGMVASEQRVRALTPLIHRHFGGRVFCHSFAGLQTPNATERFHVLEAFAAGVDKWRGLTWLAQQQGIAPQRIAVIGDEINDLTMLRQAGCAVAMGNAVEQAKSLAHHVTLRNDDDGVAHAIDRMLSGEW